MKKLILLFVIAFAVTSCHSTMREKIAGREYNGNVKKVTECIYEEEDEFGKIIKDRLTAKGEICFGDDNRAIEKIYYAINHDSVSNKTNIEFGAKEIFEYDDKGEYVGGKIVNEEGKKGIVYQIIYDLKNMKIAKVNGSKIESYAGAEIDYYNKDRVPICTENYNGKAELEGKVLYTYNGRREYDGYTRYDKEGKEIKKYFSSYEYDDKGNWIKRIIYNNEKKTQEDIISIATRDIEYR